MVFLSLGFFRSASQVKIGGPATAGCGWSGRRRRSAAAAPRERRGEGNDDERARRSARSARPDVGTRGCNMRASTADGKKGAGCALA